MDDSAGTGCLPSLIRVVRSFYRVFSKTLPPSHGPAFILLQCFFRVKVHDAL
ncbi:MAG: hypothetical protein HYZ15_08720 [Sphingobacteriales bacterium]|nr:hypothetical protein [Sphingobacteriales bacterium]